MNDRAIKRLLAIFVVSIIAIMLFKLGLTKAYTSASKVAAENNQAATTKPAVSLEALASPASSEVIETPAASVVGEATEPDSLATSSVNEAR